MDARSILEVDTPVLSRYGITDPYIESIQAPCSIDENASLYLQTSPEFYMKRLLAASSGSIYQIAHVFRNEESGKRHQIEFNMLEWYRTGFDYHQLMEELGELLVFIGLGVPDKMTYAAAFMQVAKLDPHTAEIAKLHSLCKQHGWQTTEEDRHILLDYIYSEIVMKNISNEKPLIIYDYPACMSALATLKQSDPVVSERFELFINNMEIANGFNELTDAEEQLERFEAELALRKKRGQAEPPIDKPFLAALSAGLPECAGVAVGIERLLMVLSEKDDIKDVTTFTLGSH